MGIRKWQYIYKQKPRIPDEREAVVINKIALEYRKLRALQNGGYKDSLAAASENLQRQAKKAQATAHQATQLKFGVSASK